MFNKITSAAINGIDGLICNVEVDFSNGIPFFNMVGLLSSEIKEARERIRISIKNSGYELLSKKITVNISPANIRKSGTSLDLPIAIGILSNTGVISRYISEKICIIGELSLNGDIMPVKGVISMIESAKKYGCTHVILPAKNIGEASIIPNIILSGVKTLKDTVEKLNKHLLTDDHNISTSYKKLSYPDFSNIKNQPLGIRSALISASGNHNLLIVGENGIGKTLICNSIMSILPELSVEETIEITKIHSISGLNENNSIVYNRPFRTPHPSMTISGLIGGGAYPLPGELSLAHNGVLYLDELASFKKEVLNALRTPLERKKIILNRNSGKYIYPANTLLLASMNHCPCGAYPNIDKCKCSKTEILMYKKKIGEAFLDRIELVCNLKKPLHLNKEEKTVSSAELKKLVKKARNLQLYRNKKTNSCLDSSNLDTSLFLEDKLKVKLNTVFEKLNLSIRGYVRVIKVARTIADIEQSENINQIHLDEALFFERNRGFNE